MITPKEVAASNLNVRPYEQQIDAALRAPWTEDMKRNGRKISLRIGQSEADVGRVLRSPSPDQRDVLRRIYTSAGWSFMESSKEPDEWIFQYPKGKTP